MIVIIKHFEKSKFIYYASIEVGADFEEKKSKRKDSKKIFSKKESKDKGYLHLSLDQAQNDSILSMNK